MAAILQMTYLNEISWQKICTSWFKFHWCLLVRVQFTKKSVLVHVLAWCQTGNKPINDDTHASPGINELKTVADGKTITSANVENLLNGPLATNFIELWIKMKYFSFKKMCCKKFVEKMSAISFLWVQWVNILRPGGCMCELVNHINNGLDNGLLPDGTKPLSEPMLTSCLFDYMEHITMKFDFKFRNFPSRKWITICHL